MIIITNKKKYEHSNMEQSRQKELVQNGYELGTLLWPFISIDGYVIVCFKRVRMV